jgi:hypothetical protein
MRIPAFLILFLIASGISRAENPGAKRPAGGADTLDQKMIQAEYTDGNFENVIQLLEAYRTDHSAFRAVDSFFVAKYLGVVYTSNPNTREKGKYWLYRMLQLDPTAELVDMYVGEEVDHTFEKVRQEFIVRRNYRGINDVKLAKAVKDGETGGRKDTVVVRDTVMVKDSTDAPLPARKFTDFRFGWTWNLNAGLGMKFLNKDEWAITGQQTEFRVAFDVRQRRWPINIAADFMHSQSSEASFFDSSCDCRVKYQQTTTELNAGVRKIFDRKLYSMRPFLGGGFGYISTQMNFSELISALQQGNMGIWLDGGVYWELERHFNIGLEGLYSWAKINYETNASTEEANAGGMHIQMILGYHW